MKHIFTFMLVRNLPKINFESIYKNYKQKRIINKPACKPNLEINEPKHTLYYSLCV
jgi:hypothetical protein